MYIFINGLATGLVLQLAIGPVFFFIINLALQRSLLDGLVGALAVTLVDYFYIVLAIAGIGKLLENKRVKRTFGVVSSLVLMLFGAVMIKGFADSNMPLSEVGSASLLASFTSVLLLIVSSPMTIVFFTSLFAAKAIEYNYNGKEVWAFGLGAGFATFLFMGSSVVLFSLLRGSVPIPLIQGLNLIVGCLLAGYGGIRFVKILRSLNQAI